MLLHPVESVPATSGDGGPSAKEVACTCTALAPHVELPTTKLINEKQPTYGLPLTKPLAAPSVPGPHKQGAHLV